MITYPNFRSKAGTVKMSLKAGNAKNWNEGGKSNGDYNTSFMPVIG